MITRILCTDLAGLRAQALGLAEAAGLTPDLQNLKFRSPWDKISPGLWLSARWAVEGAAFAEPLPPVVMGAGGAGARVAAALRRPGVKTVAIQHPRMALDKFDLVMAARHDGISGDNVVVTRTALHRVTPARLAAEAIAWAPFFAPFRRPLVAVLLGGSNGRYRFDPPQARDLAAQFAAMMERDRVGLVITPSRRTDPDVVKILQEALLPRGAWIWDGSGENPYFGMLACADAIIVTADSVSMVSEAVATSAPVLLVRLPGRSARIGAFMDALVEDGRACDFAGHLKLWDTKPLDDTAMAAAELRRRLGLE
ncbi:MAG TPA: mitochondrial fission ELM1 family protein [Acidocella sp.]|uniref:mitochondrial fission ELM1 family protein n=1 Tax=Acidocella sp. TaxID=50710 RepID=UPI002CEF4580|nr:mitochondrial fission ELM1 family protein [Acidocella sp.]HVE20886.1 mitochondrial fission ELM1 family protein [Acidocella sp.]